MEQRAAIPFRTLKGLKAKNVETELEPVYDNGTIKMRATKWRWHFFRGELTLEMTQGLYGQPGPIFLA
jgi:hypothetical protein